MYELTTEMEMAASAERVWSILMNFAKYPQWNPFIRFIEGKAHAGEHLTVRMHPPGGRAMQFRPEVLMVKPHRELRWRGRFIMPGIFDGEHYFLIEPLGADRVKFVQGEEFSGILIPFMKGQLNGRVRAGFVAMNEALKGLAEGALKPESAK